MGVVSQECRDDVGEGTSQNLAACLLDGEVVEWETHARRREDKRDDGRRTGGVDHPLIDTQGVTNRPQKQKGPVPTKNSHLLAGRLPNARLKIYAHAAHGFLFEYHAEFAGEIERFLNDERSG